MITNQDAKEQVDGPDDPLLVKGSPTKGFFVYTLTKDIQLDRAIADLVDNSVDGAKRLRDSPQDTPAPTDDSRRYGGLYVDITVNDKEFLIKDNCGGVPLEVARKYAFKFGRDEDFIETANSVGQFGVGMKRALLKIGAKFTVQTHNSSDKFSIDVDVNAWLSQESWDFRIASLEVDPDPDVERGTSIHATHLNKSVSETFSQAYFVDTILRNRIKTAQQHFIRNGLRITLNGVTVVSDAWQLRTSSGISAHYEKYEEDMSSGTPIRVRIYAGLGESTHARAGWYIFCNGRCVLESDQSNTTGWGEVSGSEGVSIPRYHGQFSRFRGFAFLDCAKAEKLPWNSTKTDLDLESPLYRNLRTKLVTAMRPIVTFLNALDSEKDYEPNDQILTKAILTSHASPLSTLPEKVSFSFLPASTVMKGPLLVNISYKKPKQEVDELARKLGKLSARDAGISSFDFAYQRLITEDDL